MVGKVRFHVWSRYFYPRKTNVPKKEGIAVSFRARDHNLTPAKLLDILFLADSICQNG